MTCELDCFDDSCQFQECDFSTSSRHPMGKDLREVEHHHDHHSKGDGDYTMATADMTESMGEITADTTTINPPMLGCSTKYGYPA